MNIAFSNWQMWVEALGWTLVHFVWQGLVVGLVFAALRALLPRTRCEARYAAGLLSLCALLVWPVVTFVSLIGQWKATETAGVPLGGMTMSGDVVVAPSGSGALVAIGHALPWLTLLWGVGVLVMAARALRHWRALAGMAARAEANNEIDALLDALVRRFGLARRVRVLVSSCVDTPMLIGWLKPVILLPTAVALGFPRQQLELILAHELGHLRRFDHLVNLAQAVLETVLFYHPVVHWISREVRNERELCCDALVLRLSTREPKEYAHTLAALEELRHGVAPFALAAGGGELLERVRRIVGVPAPHVASHSLGAGQWLLLLATIGAAVGAIVRAERDEPVRVITSAVSMSWLSRPDLNLLSTVATHLDFIEPQRLRLATLPKVDAPKMDRVEPAVVIPSPAAAPAKVEARAVSREQAPVASTPVIRAPAGEAIAPVPAAVAAPEAAPALRSAVSDAGAGSSVREPADAAPSADLQPAKPVAMYTVAPEFPPFSPRSDHIRVDASFTIAADGSVKGLRVTDHGAGNGFARAAERALRQWRFDPKSVTDHSLRYSQSFVFAVRGDASNRDGCYQPTGSLICRGSGSDSSADGRTSH